MTLYLQLRVMWISSDAVPADVVTWHVNTPSMADVMDDGNANSFFIVATLFGSDPLLNSHVMLEEEG